MVKPVAEIRESAPPDNKSTQQGLYPASALSKGGRGGMRLPEPLMAAWRKTSDPGVRPDDEGRLWSKRGVWRRELPGYPCGSPR